jgi:hypothetical protein
MTRRERVASHIGEDDFLGGTHLSLVRMIFWEEISSHIGKDVYLRGNLVSYR